jgi:hypothetical protein
MSSKTIKRGILGGDDIKTKSGNDELDRILEGGVNDAYKRPWHRLERGLRLNRLRLFVTEEATRVNLTEVESMQLLALLQKSLDKKILNSKTTVIYDQEEEKIKEIKGLVSHRESDGLLKYRFIEKRSAVTMRRKRSVTTGGAGSAEQ